MTCGAIALNPVQAAFFNPVQATAFFNPVPATASSLFHLLQGLSPNLSA